MKVNSWMKLDNLKVCEAIGWKRINQTPGLWWGCTGYTNTEFLPNYTTDIKDILGEYQKRKFLWKLKHRADKDGSEFYEITIRERKTFRADTIAEVLCIGLLDYLEDKNESR